MNYDAAIRSFILKARLAVKVKKRKKKKKKTECVILSA